MKNIYYPEAEKGRAFAFVGNSNILIIGIIFIVIVTFVYMTYKKRRGGK